MFSTCDSNSPVMVVFCISPLHCMALKSDCSFNKLYELQHQLLTALRLWYVYPHTNGQKTNGIFNSYQNSDSLGFCPLVPSSYPFHHRGLVGLSAYNSYASVQSLFLSCAVSALLRLAWLLTFNTAVKSDEDLRSIKTKLLLLLVGHSLEG